MGYTTQAPFNTATFMVNKVPSTNIILSLNSTIFDISPSAFFELVEKHDPENIIKGIEVALLDENLKSNMDYIKKLATICREQNYIFNLHAKPFSDIKDDQNYLDVVANLALTYGNRINLVIHPISKENDDATIKYTKEYLGQLLNYIHDNNYHIDLSIENLNILNGEKRLKKEQLVEILETLQDLKFTYDIGHEIVDGVIPGNLSEILKQRINNIHVHSFLGKNDHYLIGTEKHDNALIDTVIDLIVNDNYDGWVVLEYGLGHYSVGNNLEEKIINYIELAKDFQKRIDTDSTNDVIVLDS